MTSPSGGRHGLRRAGRARTVPKLMGQVVDVAAREATVTHTSVVRAAMAHLHVVSVHPFSDGNGRSRAIVQSLVLARDGLLAPEFGSIEEYLGRNTGDYYARPARGAGRQLPARPRRDAVGRASASRRTSSRSTARRAARDGGARWTRWRSWSTARGWPDRLVIALEQSLVGGAERAAYAAEADVSLPTASGGPAPARRRRLRRAAGPDAEHALRRDRVAARAARSALSYATGCRCR